MGAISELIKISSDHETAESFNSLVIGGGIAVILVFVIAIAFLVLVYQFAKTNKDNSSRQNEFLDNLVKMFVSSQNDLKVSLEEIKQMSGMPFLNKEALYEVFKYISKAHILEKKVYVENILLENDIHNRKTQIKRNIEIKFRDITQKKCNVLSMFNTSYGDIGRLFCDWVIWDKLLDQTYCVVLSSDEIPRKLNDLNDLLNGHLSDFWDSLTK